MEKTALAWQIAAVLDSDYLDLESPSDLAKPTPTCLADHQHRLVILDGVGGRRAYPSISRPHRSEKGAADEG